MGKTTIGKNAPIKAARSDNEMSHAGRVSKSSKGGSGPLGAAAGMKSPKADLPKEAQEMATGKLEVPPIDAPQVGVHDTWDQKRDRALAKQSRGRR